MMEKNEESNDLIHEVIKALSLSLSPVLNDIKYPTGIQPISLVPQKKLSTAEAIARNAKPAARKIRFAKRFMTFKFARGINSLPWNLSSPAQMLV